ncbi:hypothetical protein [Oerskovia enterophila]|uniref:Uncharacterized protein n=1 Tax=Oerskovia enterophila TaxID=43678 RepID=A0ABX2Y5I0_9CELL|nr:hypothetical protein [Oerskovia enterophila]OCI31827.1 hypothetical protein OERS_15000 [Oerskovia enterophila]
MSTTTHTAPDLDTPDQDPADDDVRRRTPDGGAAGPETTSGADDDVRDQIEAGVLFANGRLAWAHPELGDQVVEFNPVCDCSV